MSRKHVVEYYDEVCKQYYEFIEEIKDFEQEVQNGMVAPETIDNIKSMLEPLKTNWQMLNYVIFLLNKPTKKSKGKLYEKQNKKLLNNSITDKEVYEQNKSCIDEMKKFTSDVSNKRNN